MRLSMHKILLLLSVAVLLQTASHAAPTLVGKTLDGKNFNLADLKGKVVLVAFWATWCPTCRAEMPEFRRFYESHRAQGFELVTVSIDDELKDIQEYSKYSTWITSKAQSFPMMWRKDAGYQDDFGRLWGTPSSFLINRDGEMIESWRGALKPAAWKLIREHAAQKSAIKKVVENASAY